MLKKMASWESYVAAILIILTSSIGCYFNGDLLMLMLTNNTYGRYFFFHTFGKATTNLMALIVFIGAEVPNLLARRNLYSEFGFRLTGALAGISAIPGRLLQFFISFGTLFIAFFPMRQIPKTIFVISVIVPIFVGLLTFSVRISSENCSYSFSAYKFAWFYNEHECAQMVRVLVSRMVQFQIFACCCFNFITFLKLCIDMTRKTYIENNELQSRIKRTKLRLFQCVAQDLCFIIDASTLFNESDGYGLIVNFIFNTYIWNLAHVVDGAIMYLMYRKINKKPKSTRVSTVLVGSSN